MIKRTSELSCLLFRFKTYASLIGVSSVNNTMAMAKILNTVSSTPFLVGLGIGVVTTATYNILFSKQVMEHVEEDDEDNDSAGESNESHFVPSPH